MSRSMRLLLWISVGALLSVGCKAPPKDSVSYRQELYEGCVACHGESALGKPSLGAPAIAGLDLWYLKAQLRKFTSGARGSHPQDLEGARMRPMAHALRTDENLQLIAEYVAAMPALKPQPTLEGGNADKGRIFYAPCATCHGARAEGNLSQRGPSLNHASDWYLLKQLQKFKTGVRGTHPQDINGATMRPFAMTLVDEQAMKDVVAYIMTLSE